MPFIDEDRLYENIEEKYKFAQGEARKAYSDVLNTIREMPSADVEEVRRGRWENVGDDVYDLCFRCSKCREDFSIDIDMTRFARYCSHCGAKMDGNDRKDGEVRNG